MNDTGVLETVHGSYDIRLKFFTLLSEPKEQTVYPKGFLAGQSLEKRFHEDDLNIDIARIPQCLRDSAEVFTPYSALLIGQA
jgi:hypothetical protein